LSNNQDTTKVIVDTASVIKNNQIEGFQKNVIDKGDIYSFNRLAIHYVDKSRYKELQKYALMELVLKKMLKKQMSLKRK